MKEASCPICSAALAADNEEGICSSCLASAVLDGETDAFALSSAPEIEDYEIEEKLDEGGMGVVYLARQVRFNRRVALKVIRTGQPAPDEVERFRMESEAASILDHPNIIPVFDFGEDDGCPWYAMKLVEEGSLKDQFEEVGVRSEGGRAELKERQRRVAQLMIKVARGVHHAHERGILHRDLKPSNVLVDGEGEPHITDFGLAKRLDSEIELTLSGAMVGTPAYMAPEVAREGVRGAGTGSDLYGLGAILYHLLTGRPPFLGATSLDVMRQVADEDPEELRSLNPALDGDLAVICLKCLRKEQQDRYRSAAEFADDLVDWLAGRPVRARPLSSGERLVRWCKRSPVLAAVGTIAVLAIVLGFGGIAWQWQRAESHADDLADSLTRLRYHDGLALVERGDVRLGLGHLSAVLRTDPTYEPSAEAILRTLLEKNIPFDLSSPLSQETPIVDFQFVGSTGLTIDERGEVVVWDLARWERRFALASGSANMAMLSPDGTWIVTRAAGGESTAFETQTGEVVGRATLRGDLRLLPTSGGIHPVLVREKDQCRLVDMRTARDLVQVSFEDDAEHVVSISPDHRLLAVATKEGNLRVWRSYLGEKVWDEELGYAIGEVYWSWDSSMVLGLSRDRHRVWWAPTDPEPGEEGVGARLENRADHLRLAPNLRVLALLTNSPPGMKALQLESGEPFPRYGHLFKVTEDAEFQMASDLNSPAQLFGVWDRSRSKLEICDWSDGNPVRTLEGIVGVSEVLWGETAGSLMFVGRRGQTRGAFGSDHVFGLSQDARAQIGRVVFTPEGKRLAVERFDGRGARELLFYDLFDGRELFEPVSLSEKAEWFLAENGVHVYSFERGAGVVERHTVVELDLSSKDETSEFDPSSLPFAADLAEAVSGVALSDEGELTSLNRTKRRARMENVRAQAGGGLVEWLTREAVSRSPVPGRGESRQEVVGSWSETTSLRDVCRLAPDHWKAHARQSAAYWQSGSSRRANLVFEAGLALRGRAIELGGEDARSWFKQADRCSVEKFGTRAQGATDRQVDLSWSYNRPFQKPKPGQNPGLNITELFSAMPLGLVELDRIPGIQWDLRGRALAGRTIYEWASHRQRLAPIELDPPQLFRRVHLVQALTDASRESRSSPALDGSVVSRYRLYYLNGEVREIRLRLGRDVDDWLVSLTDEQVAGKAVPGQPRVAWTTEAPNGSSATAYYVVRDNHLPAVPLKAIEVYGGSWATTQLMAITLE